MSVLWFAIGVYIVGIAVVLFVRPTIMFSASGWKEFGLANTANYTVFPFWMFAIAWAVVSYAMASLFTLTLAGSVIGDVGADDAVMGSNNVNLNNIATPASKVVVAAPAAVSAAPAAAVGAVEAPAATLPGYYILQEPSTGGPAKYVYFGEAPPSVRNVA
jgi:hypothetical protein